MSHLEGVIRDRKIQVRPTRHEEHARPDRLQYLAKELGERRIAVNAVAPGGIKTDFGGGALRDIPEVNAYIASQTALGRAGAPDDIGPVIAALLSPSHRWINAQCIEVSGGWVL